MKKYFKLAIICLLSSSLLTSCAYFGKSCSTGCNSECHSKKGYKEEAPAEKKVKKAKKTKAAEAKAEEVKN